MESEKTMPETILLGAGGPGGVLPQSHVCLSEGEMAMVRRGPDTWLAVSSADAFPGPRTVLGLSVPRTIKTAWF